MPHGRPDTPGREAVISSGLRPPVILCAGQGLGSSLHAIHLLPLQPCRTMRRERLRNLSFALVEKQMETVTISLGNGHIGLGNLPLHAIAGDQSFTPVDVKAFDYRALKRGRALHIVACRRCSLQFKRAHLLEFGIEPCNPSHAVLSRHLDRELTEVGDALLECDVFVALLLQKAGDLRHRLHRAVEFLIRAGLVGADAYEVFVLCVRRQ